MGSDGATEVDAVVASRISRTLPKISTGSPALDGVLGGGLRLSRIVEFHGESNSGKTQLAMQAVAVAANQGLRSLYIDTEGKFRPERVQEIAEARGWPTEDLLTKVEYLRVDTSFEQMDVVRSMGNRTKTAGCVLVVIDTITRNFSLELPGAKNLSARQGALAVHLSEMAREAYLGRRAFLLTNRVTFGLDHDVGIGGRTLLQMVDAAVSLEREGEKVRATLSSTGETVLMKLSKSGIG